MYARTTRAVSINSIRFPAGTRVYVKRTEMADWGPRVLIWMGGVGTTWVAASALDVPLDDLPAPRGF